MRERRRVREPPAGEAPALHQLSRWDLSDLIAAPVEQTLPRRLANLERAVARFEGLRQRLHPAMGRVRLRSILRRYEKLIEEIRILSAHGVLWMSEDTRVPQAQSHRGRLQQTLTGFHNRILFFELWWRGLDEREAEALLPSEDAQDDRNFLSRLRLTRPYTLDEGREQILNSKNSTGSRFLVTLWSMLNNRLEFVLDLDGDRKPVSRAEALGHAFSPRPELRAAAYRELGRVYQREASILGQIYIHLMKDWYDEKVQLRGYGSPIAARNVANEVPESAVRVLLEVVQANAPLFHRYFRLKARWLGLDRLHRYDLYAPLAVAQLRVPYAEAVPFILDTFGRFDRAFARHAHQVFAERHVDSEPRMGKWSGDFCSTVVPRLTPWVLVSYHGSARDVASLAHELGHAVHSMLASGRSIFTQQPTLPLAETSSVFCEMLITDRLRQEANSRDLRRELLALFLDSTYAAILRQASLVQFELVAHDAVRRGASVEELGELYMDNLRQQFGDAVTLTTDFQYEWLGIHQIFHSPFYCYAYSFGQLLALALYRRYQELGRSFKAAYLRILAHGGSAPPEQVLREAGIEVTDPEFWQKGFEIIGERIDELEALGR
jgi:oligoendopeptidase F